MSAEAVDQLISVLAQPPLAEPYVDWAGIEAGLGTSLPHDYKAFVDRVPPGTFSNELLPAYPGLRGHPANDFLAPHAHILDTFQRWRESGDGEFPHPLFPEPGGVLLWADGNSRYYWWLTGKDNPDQWQVVTSDSSFTEWQTHKTGMAQFLIDELAAGRLPRFTPYPAPSPSPRAFEPPKANEKVFPGLPLPQNRSTALIAAIDPPATWESRTDWAAVEARLNRALPHDYKAFIDACGAGTICDIAVYRPGCEGQDLFAVQAELATAAETAGIARFMSIHPQEHGLLCWGRRADGTYLAWKTVRDDPDQWTASAFVPHMRSNQFFEDMSFSVFLLRYSGVTPSAAVITGPPWTIGITFDHRECP